MTRLRRHMFIARPDETGTPETLVSAAATAESGTLTDAHSSVLPAHSAGAANMAAAATPTSKVATSIVGASVRNLTEPLLLRVEGECGNDRLGHARRGVAQCRMARDGAGAARRGAAAHSGL